MTFKTGSASPTLPPTYLEQMEKAAEKGFTDTKLNGVARAIASTCATFRGRYLRAFEQTPSASIADLCREATERDFGSTRPERIVDYLFARFTGLQEEAAERESAAHDACRREPQAYRRLLDKWLTDDLKAVIAQQEYTDGTNATAAGDWQTYLASVEQLPPRQGCPTGLALLDEALGGGLHGLTLLAAATGVGKTTLALNLARNALRDQPDLGVLFFTLEMPKTSLYARLRSLESGLTFRDLQSRSLSEAQRQALAEADGRLHGQGLPRWRFVESAYLDQGEPLAASNLTRIIRSFLQATGLARVILIIDSLQRMPAPTEMSTTSLDADHYRTTALHQTRHCTRSPDSPEGFPFLVISEIRKQEQGRPQLSLGDLTGSARITGCADTVLLLDPVEENPGIGSAVPLNLRIAKGRDGVVRTTVRVLFDHERSQFREAAASVTTSSPKTRRLGGKPLE